MPVWLLLAGVAHATLPETQAFLSTRTISSDKVSVGALVRDLGNGTDTILTAEPRLRDRLIFVRVKDQPRRTTLQNLADLLHAEWVPQDGGFQLRQRAEFRELEIRRIDGVIEQTKQTFRSEIAAAVKRVSRGWKEVKAWREALDAEEASLKTNRLEGWSERLTEIVDTKNSLEYLGTRSEATALMIAHLGRLSKQEIESLVSGRLYSTYLNDAFGVGIATYLMDPISSKIKFESRWANRDGTGIAGGVSWYANGAQTATDRLFLDRRVDNEEVRRNGFEWLSNLKLSAAPNRPSVFYPGDVDFLHDLALGTGANILSDAVRTFTLNRPFHPRLPQWEPSFLGRAKDLEGFTVRPNWILYGGKHARLESLNLGFEESVSALESVEASDVPAILRAMANMPASGRLGIANEWAPRRDCEWLHLAVSHELFEFLRLLSPNHISTIQRGEAIPFGQLSPLAQNWFRVLYFSGAPAGSNEFSLGMDLSQQMFYFERYCKPYQRMSDASSRVVSGGINDGVERAFTGNPVRTNRSFYRYEYNFYFGESFEKSVRYQAYFDNPIAPPAPIIQGDEPPPHRHEGHGPE